MKWVFFRKNPENNWEVKLLGSAKCPGVYQEQV